MSKAALPPAINWIRALVDTGCTNTAIHTTVATDFGLTVIGKTPATSSTHLVTANFYFADVFVRILETQQEVCFPNRQLIEMLHPHTDFQALLGMDLITLGILRIDGTTRNATFRW